MGTSPPLHTSLNFGHEILSLFQLDPEYTNLNSGSFGSLPRPVLEACNTLSAHIESNPDRFIRLEYNAEVDRLRARLADFIGASVDDCVLVPNVATGINTILRNIEWNSGDVIILPTSTYSTVARNIQAVFNNPSAAHLAIESFPLTFPTSHASILSRFNETIIQIKHRITSESSSTSSSSRIVAIFDSLVSFPGVLMPWKEMVKICKAEGVMSIIDAAHSIGQEAGLNISEVDPDFWVSNCSKWLYAKRGSALLYVARRNQYMIKSSVPPALMYLPSSDNEKFSQFVTQFYWTGSSDIVSLLSASAALDFRQYIGGEDRIIKYCHSLAVAGGQYLAGLMGTRLMDSSEVQGELIANMVNVQLPLSGTIKPSDEITRKFQDKLLLDHKVYASHFYHNGCWWVRACAQVFNEISDFKKLGEALICTCEEIGRSK